jgi:hypothetical protein
MSRIIEIVLFLTPLLGFAAWRLWFPSPTPPLWLIYGTAGFVALLLMTLAWVWHLDAGDASQPYVPAELHNGRVVAGHQGAPP